jgi:Zn-dependent protease with chaperone function
VAAQKQGTFSRQIGSGVALDRLLAASPVYLWTALPLALAGAALGLGTNFAPLVILGTLILTPLAYRRNRAAHQRALASGLAAAAHLGLRPEWRERLALIERLTADYASRIGVRPPVIAPDPNPGIEVNMAVFHSALGPEASVLLVNEAILCPALSEALEPEGLRGVVAHEIGHLRAGATRGDQISALLSALRGNFLFCALIGYALLGAPAIVVGLAAATFVLLGAGGLLIHRREEIEANLVAAALLGDGGARAVLRGAVEAIIAQRSLAYAILPHRKHALRLRAALLEATGFGVPSLRAPLESWAYTESPEDLLEAPQSPQERLSALWRVFSHPCSDHPSLASLAVLLGVRPER